MTLGELGWKIGILGEYVQGHISEAQMTWDIVLS
jgi:hypothetical protein